MRRGITARQDLDRTGSDIADLQGTGTGHITVAVVESVASSILPNVIDQVRSRSPGMTFTVGMAVMDVRSWSGCHRERRGRWPAWPSRCASHPTCIRPLSPSSGSGAAAKPDHPLAKKKSITLSSYLGFPLILATPDLSITNLLEPISSQFGPSFLSPVITCGSIELMQELVIRGHGIAFQTRVGPERKLAEGLLVHILIDAKEPLWSDLASTPGLRRPVTDNHRECRAMMKSGNPVAAEERKAAERSLTPLLGVELGRHSVAMACSTTFCSTCLDAGDQLAELALQREALRTY